MGPSLTSCNKGVYRKSSCPQKGIAQKRCIAAIVTPIAVQSDTQRPGLFVFLHYASPHYRMDTWTHEDQIRRQQRCGARPSKLGCEAATWIARDDCPLSMLCDCNCMRHTGGCRATSCDVPAFLALHAQAVMWFNNFKVLFCVLWEKNFEGLRNWVSLPKFCGTFGILWTGSSAGSLLCKPSCKTPPNVPQNSGKEKKARTRLLKTGPFVLFLPF